MKSIQLIKLSEAVQNYDLILFDIWGVIVEGDHAYEGVVDSINKIMQQTDVLFVTNAPKTSLRVSQTLQGFGISEASADNVMTSGDVARNIILESNNTHNNSVKIYHLGEDRNTDLLENMDYTPTNDLSEANILLLSLYQDEHEDVYEFDTLLEQAAILQQKSELLILCSNPDTTIPNRGKLRYCSGYFSSIIEKFGGEVVYTGKPKNIIYESVFKKKPNIQKNRILMVGDTCHTDILGAINAGIHSTLVLSGNAHTIHKDNHTIDDKLSAITEYTQKIKIIPNFITKIADE